MAVAMPFLMWATSGTFAANAFLFAFKIVSYALVGLGIGAIAKHFVKKPSLNGASPLQMTKEPTPVRRVIYGETRTSGPLLYAGTHGTSREFLHMVVPLATHECEAIGNVYFNDKVIPLDAGGGAIGTLAGFARVKKHLGADDQTADTDLIAETGGIWTADDRVAGSAYLYARLKWDQDKFPHSMPNLSAVVKGKKLYDPRTEATAWSDNVALCVRDYLTNPVYGLGVAADEIDEESFIAAANICDETVAIGAGGTEKRYTANGTFELSSEPGLVLEKLCGAMAGWVVFVGGKWVCHAGAHETPTVTLDEDDLRAPLTVQTKLSLRDTCNLVKGTFTSPTDQYQPADFPPVSSATYLAEDQGMDIPRDMELPFTQSASMAQRLAKIELQRTRRDTTVQMPCKLTALRVRAGSTVALNNARYGWTGKQFLVVSHKFITYGEGSLGVDLVLRETDSAVYSWTSEEENPYLPNDVIELDWSTVPPPTALTLASGTTEALQKANGTYQSRIKATWTAPANIFVTSGGHIRPQYKRSAAPDWITLPLLPGNVTELWINDVSDGENYDVRLVALNLHGVESVPATVTEHTVGSHSTTSQDSTLLSDPSNLCYNPTFEAGDLGWHKSGGWLLESTAGEIGWGARKSTAGAGVLGNGYQVYCRPGDSFYVRARVKGSGCYVRCVFILADLSEITVDGPEHDSDADWWTSELIATAPENVRYARLEVVGDTDACRADSCGVFRYMAFQSVGTPSIDPPSQLFSTSITITASTPAGSTLRYTTDGSPVDPSDPVFPSGGLTLTQTTTLKVRAFADTSLARSAEISSTYTKNDTDGAVATPAYSWTGLYGRGPITVTLACATPGATIKYRIDGGAVTTYAAPFTLLAGNTMQAWAEKAGLGDSASRFLTNEYTPGGGGILP